MALVCIPASPTCWVALGKGLSLSGPEKAYLHSMIRARHLARAWQMDDI